MQSAIAAILAALALTACVTTPTGTPPLNEPAPTPPPAAAAAHGEVIARNDRLLIYVPVAGESLRGIAARLLGSEDRDWQISEANAGATKADPGQPLIVPLKPMNPVGVRAGSRRKQLGTGVMARVGSALRDVVGFAHDARTSAPAKRHHPCWKPRRAFTGKF